MKLLYALSDHGIPVFGKKGASIHVQELVNAFVDLGHEVTVLAARIGDRAETVRAEVVKVRAEDPQHTTPSGESEIGDRRLDKERHRIGAARAMEAALVSRHARQPYDFVYERYSLWSVAGVRAAKRLGIPSLIEVNAPLLLEQRRFRELALAEVAEAVEREVFSTADVLVAVSREVAKYAIEHGGTVERTVVVPNGVDTNRFKPDAAPVGLDGVGPDAFVVGFVGSLKAWHDHECLLDAFRLIRRDDANAHLLIVGDGPSRQWIEGYVRGAGLDGAVTVTGWTPYDSLPGFVRRMDVAVAPYPALEDFYFSPLKLYEYMASGRPVVATAIGQVCDVLDDRASALLVSPGDPEELAEKIVTLRDDAELARRLGGAALARARTHTWQTVAQRLVEVASARLEAA